jgi:hypothetical protein
MVTVSAATLLMLIRVAEICVVPMRLGHGRISERR